MTEAAIHDPDRIRALLFDRDGDVIGLDFGRALTQPELKVVTDRQERLAQGDPEHRDGGQSQWPIAEVRFRRLRSALRSAWP